MELSGYDPEMAECKSAVIANFTIAPNSCSQFTNFSSLQVLLNATDVTPYMKNGIGTHDSHLSKETSGNFDILASAATKIFTVIIYLIKNIEKVYFYFVI